MTESFSIIRLKSYIANISCWMHRGQKELPHCGTIYLFASNLQEVTFPDDTDGIYSYPYPGQLYRINLDEVSSAAIDGREVFVCASTAAQFRHHTSLRKAVSAK